MWLIILASTLAGATTASAIYQTFTAMNSAWLCLLSLNIVWIALILLGLAIEDR